MTTATVPRRFRLLTGTRENLTHCPACTKRTFRPYLDELTGERVERHGRCNREEKCGHSSFPFELLGMRPQGVPIPAAPRRERIQTTFIHGGITAQLDCTTDLHEFIRARFGAMELRKTYERFHIGGAAHQGHRYAIFWHIDQDYNVHTGKMMRFAIQTRGGLQVCKRVREPGAVNWVHSAIPLQDETGARVKFGQGAGEEPFTQTLFGLPQLKTRPRDPVAIVEGYKAAIIASIYYPHIVWLAADSLGSLTAYETRGRFPVMEPLRGRGVYLVADFKGRDKWQADAARMRATGIAVEPFPYMDALNAVASKLGNADDIEDVLLRFDHIEFMQRMDGNKTSR